MESEPVRAFDPPLLVAELESEEARRRKRPWIWITVGAGALLVVGLVTLGLLATLVVPNVLQKYSLATKEKAKVDIAAIEYALKEYAIRNGGKYPESLEALVTPDVNGQTFLDAAHLPRDPWGREYIYEPPGPGQPQPIVRSYGRDGQPGGEGDDADVDNLSIRQESNTRR